MTEKVKLTKEQADGIEDLKKKNFSDESIIAAHIREPNGWQLDENVALNRMPLLKLVDALRIGYEVEPLYKPGDKVMVLWLNKDKEQLYKILKVNFVEGIAYEVEITGEFGFNVAPVSIIRHATPEEIKAVKERRLWKSIGRKVGDFKEKDLVVYEKRYFRLFNNMGCEIYGNHMDPAYASELYEKGSLRGYYPAESFISFESEESE